MARITNYGSTPAHSSMFGIRHKNIAKKLDLCNWKKKAIVRDGIYLYIQKGVTTNKEQKNKTIYTVFGLPEYHSFEFLNDAILFANSYDDSEGIYPNERGVPWHIGPVMKFPKKSWK